jgi:transcriptional regulator with XRE-family HTH domain
MDNKKEYQDIPVGGHIKTIREGKGLSLAALADLTGFSMAILSQIENHLISPSLGTLIKLAGALGVRVGDFLGETSGEPFSIVRAQERKQVSCFGSTDGVKYGYSYESLGFEKKDRRMEPFIVTLEPATVKITKPSLHEGEEFIFVMEGEMEVTLGNHKDVLYPGDCIYYNSTIPHLVQSHGETTARILAVLYSDTGK